MKIEELIDKGDHSAQGVRFECLPALWHYHGERAEVGRGDA